MYGVFAFDLETCIVENQLYCEPYEAGVYHPNRLYQCFNRDLTISEVKTERENVHMFDRGNNNPLVDMIDFVITNY